jgi:hypothetical protein
MGGNGGELSFQCLSPQLKALNGVEGRRQKATYTTLKKNGELGYLGNLLTELHLRQV